MARGVVWDQECGLWPGMACDQGCGLWPRMVCDQGCGLWPGIVIRDVVSDVGFDQGCGLWPGFCVAQVMMWSNVLRCWADILGTTVLHMSVLDFMLHILVMHFGENSDALR